jgi:hypothetical protein
MRHEGVHDDRGGEIADVHGVEPEAVPVRPERAEHLPAGDPPAALDAARGRGGQRHRDVVADLGVPGGEDVAVRDVPDDQVRLTLPPHAVQVGGHAHPVVVHAGRQGRGR